MARQTGGTKRVGTIGNICFYKMRGKYYLRTKSSLTAKMVLTQDNFARTRFNAAYLSQASKIGSKVYQLFHHNERERSMYRLFTGEAFRLLKQGIDAAEVERMMIEKYSRK